MEAQAPHVAGAVQHAYNDGFARGYAEVDIVVAVHDNAEAGADAVARAAAMTKPGNLLQVATEVRKVTCAVATLLTLDKRA